MENNYKPTKKEVLKEIVTPSKKLKDYLKTSLESNLCLYAIPTAIRKNLPEKNNAGSIIGSSMQGSIYLNLYFEDIPAYLLPLATNVLSGIYELGRLVYKKAEKRVISKNLEKIAEE